MQPTEIIPRVWIGDAFTAQDRFFFKEKRIGLVVNCTPNIAQFFPTKFIRIPVNDSSSIKDNEIMKTYLPYVLHDVVEYLLTTRDNGVLIHCAAGVSRSCTVACALLRFCCTKTIDEAIKLIIKSRPQAFLYGYSINFNNALKQIFHE